MQHLPPPTRRRRASLSWRWSRRGAARALKPLEQKGLVRQMFGSRVERYEHQMAQRFSLTTAQTALVGLLLLRGPQTAHELLARAERMARFSSIEDLRTELDMLIGRRPPLIQEIQRGPGQREDRLRASAERSGGGIGSCGAMAAGDVIPFRRSRSTCAGARGRGRGAALQDRGADRRALTLSTWRAAPPLPAGHLPLLGEIGSHAGFRQSPASPR